MSRDEVHLLEALTGLRTPLDLARLLYPDVLLELAAGGASALRVGRPSVLRTYLPPTGWGAQVGHVHVQHVDADVYLVGVRIVAESPDKLEYRADITARVTFRSDRVAVIRDYAQPELLRPIVGGLFSRSSHL